MSTVSTDRHDRVLIVRIEREERRNAINRETAEGIEAALNLLDDDPDLWVGIITGTPSIFAPEPISESGPIFACPAAASTASFGAGGTSP
ncbi:hypothetical protein GCM10020255_109320 [Rhodococcus baikonurensis]